MCRTQQDITSIFTKSIEAVHPPKLIKKHISLNEVDNLLHVYNKTYKINNNCYIVGFGKAVYEMSQELEKILGNHLVWGFVSIPYGMKTKNKTASRVVYQEGAKNNLPDKAAECTAKEIADLAQPLTKNDILFVLISGGGSALLPAPLPEIPLRDKSHLIKILANQGASIIEINSVRKKISTLKGGGLARLAHPAQVVALILSDVIGDPLDFIASGPTVPNSDPPQRAKEIILKYIPDPESNKMPESVRKFLQTSQNEKPSPKININNGNNYEHVNNFLIGNNTLALREAAKQAQILGYDVTVMSHTVAANVETVSKAYRSIALDIYQILSTSSADTKLTERLYLYKDTLGLTEDAINALLRSVETKTNKCLIFGGEPTVLVKGSGQGGRNQHLALQFSVNLDRKLMKHNIDIKPMSIRLLCGGTDGIDGPTDAAGAIGFNGLTTHCQLDFNDYLARNDSYNFYKNYQNGDYLLLTGHTGTNVMDVHILLINPH